MEKFCTDDQNSHDSVLMSHIRKGVEWWKRGQSPHHTFTPITDSYFTYQPKNLRRMLIDLPYESTYLFTHVCNFMFEGSEFQRQVYNLIEESGSEICSVGLFNNLYVFINGLQGHSVDFVPVPVVLEELKALTYKYIDGKITAEKLRWEIYIKYQVRYSDIPYIVNQCKDIIKVYCDDK